ncbi:N-acetylmuramoyl-L-alanine amidase family protein [Staphylococcus hyicus]|uniref:peptidoglycan recognition protein family protein n=1 Tax=Staphylococcus hyicus TaxID=1284 RepID=UPI0036D24E71
MGEVWNGVPVRFDLLPFGTRRTGQPLKTGKPKFAVMHDTGNKNSTAQQNVNYYKNSANISWAYVASAHIFVDDKECIICIPVTEKAWHVLYDTPLDNRAYGVDANDAAFGLEGSYFDDKQRSLKSLDNCARVMAYLCKYWGIDYRTHVPGHQDIQGDKIDPGNLLAACGYSRSMANFDKQVAKYINGVKPSLVDKLKPTSKKPASEKPVKSPVKLPTALMTQKDALKYALSLEGVYIDFDKAHKFQCMDTAVHFVHHVTGGKLTMWGNAKDALKNNFPEGWEIVENTPDYIPPLASIAVWTGGVYERWGHIALVVDNKGGTEYVTVLEQNFDSKANSPNKLRKDDFTGLTHFIVPKYADNTTVDVTYKDEKPKDTQVVTKIPMNLGWSNTAHFRAKADSAGVAIAKANHNHNMVVTKEEYPPGTDFYVFEIVDGWCRVYSPDNDGWVWYERLILKEVYKPLDPKKNLAPNLTKGTIPPLSMTNSSQAKFRAKADKFGVTICKKQGSDYVLTNEQYKAGYNQFYVFEIVDGWCRVYSNTNNGWVWRERLILEEVY